MNKSVYLDYAGSGLYTTDQLSNVFKELNDTSVVNPHSGNQLSRDMIDRIDLVRFRILSYFNTSDDEYRVVFTSGCTAALDLVARTFNFSKCDRCAQNDKKSTLQRERLEYEISEFQKPAFIYLQDNHTSVVGMRETAKQAGANIYCVQPKKFENCIEAIKLSGDSSCTCSSLVAWPAQSNFCGKKYPKSWHSLVKNAPGESKIYTCLDAAAYVSNNYLDLSSIDPDFITISFYKLFGYPTGLGALLVKNKSEHVLYNNTFGGGSVLVAPPMVDFFVSRYDIAERFEHGTISFLSILALRHGFDLLDSLGGIKKVSDQVFKLAMYAYSQLISLRHHNGVGVVKIYGWDPADAEHQGSIINFNLFSADSQWIGYSEVGKLADAYGIVLRSGCFCNVGACQLHLNLTDDDILANFHAGKVCGDSVDLIEGRPVGSVRVSLGFKSRKEDVDYLLKMITECFMELSPNIVEATDVTVIHASGIQAKNSAASECQSPTYTDRQTGSRTLELLPKGANTVSLVDDSIQLSGIFIYPIKSAPGVQASKWFICQSGLIFDRRFMVTELETNMPLTQRKCPSLIALNVQFDKGVTKLEVSDKCGSNQILIPLNNTSENDDGPVVSICKANETKVCSNRIETEDCGMEASNFISKYLGTPSRIVRQSDSPSNEGSFANQAQFLLVSLQSVKKFMQVLLINEPTLTVDQLLLRFRANLVIDSERLSAFEEEQWNEIEIGNIRFQVVGRCTRCQMICIDQFTGQTKNGVLAELRKFRPDGKLTFGIYLKAIELDPTQQIAVGDSLRIVS